MQTAYSPLGPTRRERHGDGKPSEKVVLETLPWLTILDADFAVSDLQSI